MLFGSGGAFGTPRVGAFLEKPKPGAEVASGEGPYWINAGGYVLDPSVFDLIPAGRMVSIEREVFPLLVGKGLMAWRDDGYWNDIGTPASYLAANRDALAGRLGGVPVAALVDPSATLAARAHVNGGSVVGAGASIGVGARIHGSVLHEDASVGDGAVIEDSVVGRRARVGAGARVVGQSMLGAGVVVASGASLDGECVFPEEA